MEALQETRKSIREAMQYAVPAEGVEVAEDLLDMYRDDSLALSVLKEFYTCLPEAQEDWVREIRLINRKAGIFLLAVMTGADGYLYLVSSEGIEFQGCLSQSYMERDLLDFFAYTNLEAFQKLVAQSENFPVYEPLQVDEKTCPACHAFVEEYHELGCPVEVCPWCGGQLVGCSCRYEKTGLDALSTEADLAEFEKVLWQRGRIPYSEEQRPSFADEGPGVVFD